MKIKRTRPLAEDRKYSKSTDLTHFDYMEFEDDFRILIISEVTGESATWDSLKETVTITNEENHGRKYIFHYKGNALGQISKRIEGKEFIMEFDSSIKEM